MGSREERSHGGLPPDRPDPTSEYKVRSALGSHLNRRPIYPPEERFGFKLGFQLRFKQEEYAMLMCLITGSGADEHIELSMWLRAFTAEAQRRNYQGRALPLS